MVYTVINDNSGFRLKSELMLNECLAVCYLFFAPFSLNIFVLPVAHRFQLKRIKSLTTPKASFQNQQAKQQPVGLPSNGLFCVSTTKSLKSSYFYKVEQQND